MKSTAPVPKVQQGPSEPSPEDIDRDAEITDKDVRDAVAAWNVNAPERYRGLINAGEWKGK